jgi:hypothetical protein
MKTIVLMAMLAFVVSAQDKLPKDIIRRHDKYRDTDSISTKRNDVLAKTINLQSIVSMSAIAMIEKDKPIEAVGLVFWPEAVTFAGTMAQGIGDNINRATPTNRIYFQPKAEAILLVGQEKLVLPSADKVMGWSGSGEYQNQTIVIVPVEWFYKLAASDEWSILIGDVAVGVGDPDLSSPKASKGWAKRVQPRLRALADEIRKLNQ